MYGGGMGKLGRGGGGGGGGRGGGKRSLPPPPPPAHIQRVGPSSAAARLPLGSSGAAAAAASRGRHGVGPGSGRAVGAAAVPEETFSMVSADTLDFAAVIRLTPDLVDEIKRLEAQGGAAKIKFDSNSNNLSGNVIDVGGKEFKFTWSRELGVCDIYEELQNGEDGKGLLSECGSAWRKLNVQRILDESLKNHVKMRSEEAERRLKSRKSIVLDPANPSVKNQAKTMAAAAVEGSMRRTHWKKDHLFKKRKSDPSVVPSTVTHKSVFKSGMPTNNSTGAMHSISPQPSPSEQVGISASVSPFGMSNPPRSRAIMDEDVGPLTSNASDVTHSEKEPSNKLAHGTIHRLVRNKEAWSTQPVDLRSLLVNLLVDNPKGMSLKALEKAVGEAIPNSGKKIENIIKTIATYQAPGRYILKPGVEVECSRKHPFESGSSPEHPLGSMPVTEVRDKDITESEGIEHKTQLLSKSVELDIIEKIDIEQNSPERSTVDRKVNNEDEEGARSSSESGSESGSESDTSDSESDSGSQSRSRSKSQSPMGSGSASSSDSESDGSSSSKEGSDVDVDIMTSDDDKEETGDKLPNSSRLSPPTDGRPYDGRHEENVIGRGDLHSQRTSPQMNSHDYSRGGNALEHGNTEGRSIEARIKRFENSETATTKSIISDDFPMKVQVLADVMASQDQYQQPVLQSMSSARNFTMDKNDYVGGHSSTDEQFTGNRLDLKQIHGMQAIPKAKHKRASDSRHFHEKPESSKKSRVANAGVQTASGKSRDKKFLEKSGLNSPDRIETVQYGDQMMLMPGDIDWDQNTFNSLKGADSALAGRYMVHENADRFRLNPDFHNANSSISNARQLGQRAGDTIMRGTKAFDGAEHSGRHIDNSNRAGKHPEKSYSRPDESDTSGARSTHLQDKFFMPKDKMHKDVQDENTDVNEKYSAKGHDDTGEDKPSSFPESHYKRSGDQNGIQKETKLSLNMQKADMDKCAVANEKGNPLRREISDLELGEFREPSSVEDTKGGRRQFEKKGSFKSSDSKLNVLDNFSSDSNKGRTPVKAAHEPKRQSPYMSKCGSQTNLDGSYRRMSEGDIAESTNPHQQTKAFQLQQFPRVDQPEQDPVSHLDRLSDTAGRNETRTSQGIGEENHVASHRRASTTVLAQHDTKHIDYMTCKSAKDSKTQKNNGTRNMSEQSKESFQVERITNSGKGMDSSSDEDDSFYTKYDKSEPELRGPIKDHSQYEEYVQEYYEKFRCYKFLDRHIEKYRNEFLNVGRDLELYKGRDNEAYHNILEQIMQLYYRCRKKYFQMKKVFVILHEELQIIKQRIRDFAEEYNRD